VCYECKSRVKYVGFEHRVEDKELFQRSQLSAVIEYTNSMFLLCCYSYYALQNRKSRDPN
jgi:hypothetical protein